MFLFDVYSTAPRNPFYPYGSCAFPKMLNETLISPIPSVTIPIKFTVPHACILTLSPTPSNPKP